MFGDKGSVEVSGRELLSFVEDEFERRYVRSKQHIGIMAFATRSDLDDTRLSTRPPR
jgi:hypothetical protein